MLLLPNYDNILITNTDIDFRYYNNNTGGMKMQEPILRKLFLAFIQVHILSHASKEPIYGAWMMKELEHHGYEISAGTLYPIFHNLEMDKLLTVEKVIVCGKVRKYYSITQKGNVVLEQARGKIAELKSEI